MEIGPKPFIIAELSGNHNGSLSTALELISAAKRADCDAVKIQTYEPEDLCDPVNNGLYEKCKIPKAWFPELFKRAKDDDILLFSSVFAPWAIEFLKQFNCPAYKLASPESTRLPDQIYHRLTRMIWETGKTSIASSGRADMNMVNSTCPTVLMYCVAGYPATVVDDDIKYFGTLPKQRLHRGFSDHTEGLLAPLAMIAAGATVIEKHFKLDDNCVDAAFSFNPEQMETLCRIAHR